MTASAARLFAAEAIGTALLVATVIGSGVMGERLAGGNIAIALLGNTLSTACILVVLILALEPVSGAHLNPAISLVNAALGKLQLNRMLVYVAAQALGAVIGTMLAHAMFDEQLLQMSVRQRDGRGQWLSEVVATFGLVGTILAAGRAKPKSVAYAAGLYVAGAYWSPHPRRSRIPPSRWPAP